MASEKVGSVLWRDLTVENAEQIRDFYQQVVGWQAQGEDMGGYELDGPREMGNGRFCVIGDPAGAVCALFQI